MPRKINRVVYRLWHNESAAGRIGYIGKDIHYPLRSNLHYRKIEKSCPKLYRALNKYPIGVWQKEVLASGFKSDLSLIKAEIFYIKKFNSKNTGYNLTDGGEGCSGRVVSRKTRIKISKSKLGHEVSLETRTKLSEANMGKKPSAETRAKLRKARKGRRPSLGYKHSLEAREKISKSLIGNKRSLGNKNHLGCKHSAKTRAKMRKARFLWLATQKGL